MLQISSQIQIPDDEIEIRYVRARGPGGQNVNKLSSAVHLRFNIRSSSLPEAIKLRLLKLADKRISSEGYIIIKAQRFRTQEKNRMDALDRLVTMIQTASRERKTRLATKPSRASQKRRMDSKTRRSKTKTLRARVEPE